MAVTIKFTAVFTMVASNVDRDKASAFVNVVHINAFVSTISPKKHTRMGKRNGMILLCSVFSTRNMLMKSTRSSGDIDSFPNNDAVAARDPDEIANVNPFILEYLVLWL